MGARDYDPATQTFTSADTIAPSATSRGLNRFGYAYGNPMLFIDPSGHLPGCREGSGNCGIDRYGTGLGGAPPKAIVSTPQQKQQRRKPGYLLPPLNVFYMSAEVPYTCDDAGIPDLCKAVDWITGDDPLLVNVFLLLLHEGSLIDPEEVPMPEAILSLAEEAAAMRAVVTGHNISIGEWVCRGFG